MSASIRLFLVFLVVTAAMALGVGIAFKRAADKALNTCTAVEQALGDECQPPQK